MKFLQLKRALEEAIPPPPPPPPKPIEVPRIAFFSPKEKKQTVVGGELRLTPVDRTAAMVVSKAPWWAMPPAESKDHISQTGKMVEKPQSYQPNIKRKERSMSETTPNVQRAHPAQAPGSITSQQKPNDVFNVEIATEEIKRTQESLTGIKNLVDQAQDARASLDVLCQYWKSEWMDFMDASDERLKNLRMTRMAFEVETKVLMSNLKDVRAFFLDKNHDQEVAKLKEFVDLCERLQKLKQSGFLDTVADTIIKLS